MKCFHTFSSLHVDGMPTDFEYVLIYFEIFNQLTLFNAMTCGLYTKLIHTSSD